LARCIVPTLTDGVGGGLLDDSAVTGMPCAASALRTASARLLVRAKTAISSATS